MSEQGNKALDMINKVLNNTEQIKRALVNISNKLNKNTSNAVVVANTNNNNNFTWERFCTECRKRLVPNMMPKQLSDMSSLGCEIQYLIAISGYTETEIRDKISSYNKKQFANKLADRL